MKTVKYILILLYSFTIISCSEDSSTSSSSSSGTGLVIAEETVVSTPTSDSTPNYTFTSTKAGTISYGGSCSSATTSATSGSNTITLTSLSDGTYSNCTITVTDSAGIASNTLAITSFIVDATTPFVLSTSPKDNESSVSENDNISITFSETVNNTTVTTNSSGTSCTGTFQVSSDNFSTCVQMSSSPSSSNSNKTFLVNPSSSLFFSTTYKIKVTTGVEDIDGNSMTSDNLTENGFTTKNWTKQLGSPSNDEGLGVTVDSSDNIYVTGFTEGGLDNNTNFGGKDIFLAKYNSSGFYQWTRQLGTSSYDSGLGVSVDSSDNIYITGKTSGGLDNNTNSGNSDIFLAKYNSSGAYQWTRQLGTSLEDYGLGVVFDSSDNIFVTGYTSGGLDNNTNSGSRDYFLVKYNSSGIYQWTQQNGTSSGDYGRGVIVDSSDNIYVTGQTAGGLDNNTNSGSIDIFLVKYNSGGTRQWSQQLGTTSSEIGYGVTNDSSNNIYITGYTLGGLDGNTNSGSADLFLVKYNTSGTKLWTQQLGTSSYDSGSGVTVDSSDNVYVTGYTSGELDNNTNYGNSDILLLKYNSSGVKQ